MVLGFAMFIISFVKIGDYRNYLLSFLACMVFFFLAFQSFQIQTENCRSLPTNSTTSGATTSYEYSYGCEVNEFKDNNLVYFNTGFGLISLVYGISNVLIRRWSF